MSVEVKTGALWERKNDDDEEEEVVIKSKLFLNRKAQRDFRVNEIIRKGTSDLEKDIARVTSVEFKEMKDEDEGGPNDKAEDKKEPGDIPESPVGEPAKRADSSALDAKEPTTTTATTTKKKKKLEEKCTKGEYAVAKHVRFNTQEHIGRLAGMTVKCFTAADAVNCLLDSNWAKGNASPDSEIVLTDRKSCVSLMNRFLQKGLFHRADKVEKRKDKEKKKIKKKDVDDKDKKKEPEDKDQKKEPEDKDKKKEAEDEVKASESTSEEKISNKERRLKKLAEKEAEEAKKEGKKKETTNKQKKYKLNMSDDQRFVDGNSIYVWIYDPIRPKTFFIGFLMLLGAVALCLFPLWPDWMRIGVYYASLLGASFVGFMLFLIVLRVIIFSLVWMTTLGKHHLWIFPNLTEDVGIIDSFRPMLKHDVFPPPEVFEEQLKEKKKQEEDEDKQEDEEEDKNENDFEMIDSKDNNSEENDGEEQDSEAEES